MSWKVDGGFAVCVFGAGGVKFPRINERVMFKEKFKVLVSRICGRAVRNLVIVGSVGILVGLVVYWALRYSFVAVNLTSERSSAYNVVGRPSVKNGKTCLLLSGPDRSSGQVKPCQTRFS